MIKWVLLIILLNSADALLTYFLINHGASELNPIMAFMLEQGTTQFLLAKLVLVNALAVFIAIVSQTYSIAKTGFTLITCLYAGVFLYHMVNVCQLLQGR